MTGFDNYWLHGRVASCATLALGLLLSCSATGCLPVFGQAAQQDQEAADDTPLIAGKVGDELLPAIDEGSGDELLAEIEPPRRTPIELLDSVRDALAETRSKKRPKGRYAREKWKAAQEQHIAAGVLACSEITDHEDSTDRQLREAWKSKAVLLYRAAEYGWPEFDKRLSWTVDQLKQTAFTEEAEYADGLLLVHRCFERKMPIHEVVARLTQHAQEFPGGDTCAKLFLAYANKLDDRGMRENARLCCRAAIWTLHDHPEVQSIRRQLTAFEAKTEMARNWAAVSATVQLKPDDALQRELDQQVAQVRSMLPIRVDSVTSLTQISSGTHSINYRYTVTLTAEQMEQQKASIQQKVTHLARSVGATRMALAKGVTLNYSYHDAAGNRLLAFSVTQ